MAASKDETGRVEEGTPTAEGGLDRRGWLALLGGAVGAAALSGCAPGADALGPETIDGLAAALSGDAVVVFADVISELRLLTATTKTIAILKGARTVGDGGGGLFAWSTSSAPDDGGLVLNRGSRTGAGWRRICETRVTGTLPRSVSARWFGAAGDGTTDDTAALQAALDVGAGGTVQLPAGTYVTTAPLDIRPQTRLVGAGNGSSTLLSRHDGDVLRSVSPVNTGADVRVSIEQVQFTLDASRRASATGGAVTVTAGRNVVVRGCGFAGFPYGVIFDAAKSADVLDCLFTDALIAGVWMATGADRTAGSIGIETHRISIQRCRFERGRIGVVDDGGALHRVSDCAFNLCTDLGVYAAGAEPLLLDGNQFSACTRSLYSTSMTYVRRTPCGQNHLIIRGNFFAPPPGHNACEFLNGSPVYIESNILSLSSGSFGFAGLAGCYQVEAIGNVTNGTGTMFDTYEFHGTVSEGGYETQNGRHRIVGTSPPTGDTWNAGDIVDNRAPAPGGYAGWICIVGGTPGIWKGFGLIEP